MNKKKAIEKSIEHWKRMIKWAKKQNQIKIRGITDNMEETIGETTSCEYCSLCKTYLPWGGCDKCPLGKKYGSCSNPPPSKNLFIKTMNSRTWGTWVKNAEKFVKQLNSLLAESVKK